MPSKIPGEFVPLDVNYTHDRRIREAGALAELLFIRGMAYCRRTKSHGEIPDYDLPVVGVGIPNPTKLAKKLESTGLWLRVDHGWTVRSWAKWNPSSTEEVRVKQSQGGVQGNHNRWHVDGVTSDDCPLCPSPGDPTTDRSTDQTPITHPTSVGDRSGITEVEREEEREKKDISSEVATATLRPDVTHLLDLLDKHIVANGSRPPKRNKANTDAARLLLDKDGRTVQQIEAAIIWCQSNEFWRANILSMSKLREKYDQLRLAAQRETTPTKTTTDDRVQAGIDLAQRLASQTLEIEG